MSGGGIFGYGWREDHARAGDHAIDSADAILKMMARKGEWPIEQGMGIYAQASALAAIAQAHYAAANVCVSPIRETELPSVNISSDGHIRVAGWCNACNGVGEPTIPHVDIP